jgi:capsid protein
MSFVGIRKGCAHTSRWVQLLGRNPFDVTHHHCDSDERRNLDTHRPAPARKSRHDAVIRNYRSDFELPQEVFDVSQPQSLRHDWETELPQTHCARDA